MPDWLFRGTDIVANVTDILPKHNINTVYTLLLNLYIYAKPYFFIEENIFLFDLVIFTVYLAADVFAVSSNISVPA